MVILGIEQLVKNPPSWLVGQRLGLLCNQASVDRHFRHSRDLVMAAFPGRLTCLFSPQHGFFAEKQDNMVESDHGTDPVFGCPVFSLYGETRKPTEAMFDLLDVLLVDLVDVGTRVYTFFSTLANCLAAAKEFGKKVVVLDRPNPLGGLAIEGNLVRSDCASFVGMFPIPMRPGLTLGELALLCNQEFGLDADLAVIPMRGWRRAMLFPETGLPWVFPSPNMPAFITALVYPGQVIWEGTNVSEGRGTAMPFELFGAPYIRHKEVLAGLSQALLPGLVLRPVVFEPTANKWQGVPCLGFHLHVSDQRAFRPYRTSLALLQLLLARYKDEFQYKPPPYEYEYERLPLDLILGDRSLRIALEAGKNLLDIEQGWQEELARFGELRRSVFLYE